MSRKKKKPAAVAAKAASAAKTAPLDLCCIVNPLVWSIEDTPDVVAAEKIGTKQSWCAYCFRQICVTCREKYIYDDYYHHRLCRQECPHDAKYHDDE